MNVLEQSDILQKKNLLIEEVKGFNKRIYDFLKEYAERHEYDLSVLIPNFTMLFFEHTLNAMTLDERKHTMVCFRKALEGMKLMPQDQSNERSEFQIKRQAKRVISKGEDYRKDHPSLADDLGWCCHYVACQVTELARERHYNLTLLARYVCVSFFLAYLAMLKPKNREFFLYSLFKELREKNLLPIEH